MISLQPAKGFAWIR